MNTASGGKHTDHPAGTTLLSALGLVPLCCRDDGLADLIGPPPAWFLRFFPGTESDHRGLRPWTRFPFLENFLVDAGDFWVKTSGTCLKSGIWLEHDASGIEYALEATALRLDDRRILLIEYLGDDYQQHRTLIQKAREELLSSHLQVEKLARSNVALQDFARIASHDLRAPLRAMATLCTWIEKDLGDRVADDTKTHLTALRQRANLMQRLISDLLSYSLIGSGRQQPQQLDLRAMLDDVLFVLDPPPEFECDIADPMPKLQTARTPLELVFRNLIGNAIKHHDRTRGRVAVFAEDTGDCFQFTVADDGPGIPEQFHDRVFLPFHSLQRGVDDENNGMGLALVKATVEQFGGKILLESGAGRGTRFRFTWPKQLPQPATPSA